MGYKWKRRDGFPSVKSRVSQDINTYVVGRYEFVSTGNLCKSSFTHDHSLTSTKIQAEALAQEKVQTIRYNRLVGDLADIKAILACKEQPQSRAVASIPPFRSPGRKDCSIKDIQEIIRWSKQAVNGSGSVRGLRNQRTVPLAASADRTRCPTFNPETVTGPPVVTKGGTAATAAFVNHARSKQDHNQQLRLSQMIQSGDEELVAKQYTKAWNTYCKILNELKDFGYRGTSKKGDEQIYRLQQSLGEAFLLLGDLDQAELVFEQTLHDVSERLGEHHGLVLRLRFFIAFLKGERKTWPDAIRLGTEALHATICLRNTDYTVLCTARRFLARMYEHSGDIEMSEKYYRLAIACSVQASGYAHETTIASLVHLAQFFIRHGAYETMVGSHRHKLPFLERVDSADEEESVESVVDLLSLLTNVFISEGRLKDALATGQQAVGLAAKLPAPKVNHKVPFWALVAEHLRSRARFREAENIERGLWTQLREEKGPLHFDTVKAMEGVVDCLLHQGLIQDGILLIDIAKETRCENECHDLKAIVALRRHLKSSQVKT